MRDRLAALSFGLLAGCFSDAPPVEDPECPTGAKGCPCTSGSACDPGLQCHAPSGLCFDPECERGTASCECLEGQCIDPLECREQLCQAPAPDDTGGGTGNPMTTATTSTSDAGTTTDATTMSTSVDASTSVDESSTTEPQDPCEVCVAGAEMAFCMTAYNQCQESTGEGSCQNAIACGISNNNCCPPMDQTGPVSLYEELLACLYGECMDDCGPFGVSCADAC